MLSIIKKSLSRLERKSNDLNRFSHPALEICIQQLSSKPKRMIWIGNSAARRMRCEFKCIGNFPWMIVLLDGAIE